MPKKILDSNILIYYFRKNDKLHQETKKIIESDPFDKFIITEHILSEVYTVLLLRESHKIAQKALQWIVTNPKITIEQLSEQELIQTVNYLTQNQTKLSFIDASLLILATSRNHQLLTYDKNLKKSTNHTAKAETHR